MDNLFKKIFSCLFFGTFGTTLGGIIGISLKKISNRFLSFILSVASGLMLSVVCFDLIPKSIKINNAINSFIGMIIGITIMILCDKIVNKKLEQKLNNNQLLKTGIIVSIGIALHNFPEGLAIGSGFESSIKLGLTLALTICIHDIPEGISMAAPMKQGGMNIKTIIFYIILSGIITGIGGFFGVIVGSISYKFIGLCLSFSGGTMLYISFSELMPEANRLYKGIIPLVGSLLGILLGVIAIII